MSQTIPPACRAIIATAQDHIAAGRIADAAAWLADSLALFDGVAEMYRLHAQCLRRLRRYPEALAASLKALDLEPDNPAAMLNAAQLVNALGDHLRALDLFERARATVGDKADPFRPYFPDSRYAIDYGPQALAERPFFNLGAGPWSHWAWRNIDLAHPNYPNNRPDIVHDLMDDAPIPLPDGTATLIFTSHCLEHLPDARAKRAMAEMFRVLKPGGRLRISVPDCDLAYRAYVENDQAYFLHTWPICKELPRREQYDTPLVQFFVATFATYLTTTAPEFSDLAVVDTADVDTLLAERGPEGTMDALCARIPEAYQRRYPNAHLNWFTWAKAERDLRAVGFEQVERSAYGRSRAAVMRDVSYFDMTYPFASLYVEAVKPLS